MDMNKTNDIDYDFINSIATLPEEQHEGLISPKTECESAEDDPSIIDMPKEELSQWMSKNGIIEVTDKYRELLNKK